MASVGVSLLSNAAATGNYVTFAGGRAVLVVLATAYPTTLKLQMLGKDGATAIDVATVTANGITAYDLPPGSYRMFVSGGAPSGIYADLASVYT